MSLRPRAAAVPKGAPARRGTLHGPAITLAPRAAPVGVRAAPGGGRVVAPWLNPREAVLSTEVRAQHGQEGEFYWQVRNLLTKWQNIGLRQNIGLAVLVHRLLNHWHQVEQYGDPVLLAGRMAANIVTLNGDYGITEATVQEAVGETFKWAFLATRDMPSPVYDQAALQQLDNSDFTISPTHDIGDEMSRMSL